MMYAQRGHGKRSSFYSDYTFGCWRPAEAEGGLELVPVGKAYSGFTDEELLRIDRWVRAHTINKFGPVREVEQALVMELAFDSVHPSTRHKSRRRHALPPRPPHPLGPSRRMRLIIWKRWNG